MKIEKLTDNKIRIIFNIEELSSKNITLDNLKKNNENVHSLFQSILDEAEKQIGFSTKDCKLLIEAFSSTDGYVIFTLTKYKNDLKPSTTRKLQLKRKVNKNTHSNVIYKFNNFDEFCNFCTYISNTPLKTLKGFCKNISLYKYNDFYYLACTKINLEYVYLNLFYTSISEFASLCSTSLVLKNKLDEYGNIIFKSNAIQNCIKYF